MNIQLKNIKHFRAMSEETNAFYAALYIDGKDVGYAKNDGHGGNTMIMANNAEGREKIQAAEAYCKTLPPVKGFGMEFPMDLEMYVDQLLEADLDAKELKRIKKALEKDCIKNICIGDPKQFEKPGNVSYRRFGWKLPIAEILQMPGGRDAVIKTIAKVKKELKPGEEILNDNLPQDLLK